MQRTTYFQSYTDFNKWLYFLIRICNSKKIASCFQKGKILCDGIGLCPSFARRSFLLRKSPSIGTDNLNWHHYSATFFSVVKRLNKHDYDYTVAFLYKKKRNFKQWRQYHDKKQYLRVYRKYSLRQRSVHYISKCLTKIEIFITNNTDFITGDIWMLLWRRQTIYFI